MCTCWIKSIWRVTSDGVLLCVVLSAVLTLHESCVGADVSSSDVDPQQCIVSGPGLKADQVVLPVPYVFIQAVGRDGRRLSHSPETPFEAALHGVTLGEVPCPMRVEVLDLHNGTTIVRFRIFSTCRRVELHLTHQGLPVADSPYKLPHPVQPEECDCPVGTLSDWLTSLSCPRYPDVMKQLETFRDVDFDAVLNETVHRFNSPYAQSFCNYLIKDNTIYRKCYGQHVGFNMFVDSILHSLRRKTVLPDTEFLFNLGDWPLIQKSAGPLLPMFSWCGSEETEDLVLPTYDLTTKTLDGMHRVSMDMFSVQSHQGWIPWERRRPLAFWRGRDSRRERLQLVAMSRQRPDLIDAALTHFFFFKDEADVYGPTQERVSFFDFFKYKYQVTLDGTVAAYRFPFLLAGGSLIIKQKSPYFEHFYHNLIPGQHYIEVEPDLSDLFEKIIWAQEHDHEARAIAEAGRRFAQGNLMPLDVLCYHGVFFDEWSGRLASPVRVREGMEPAADNTAQHRRGSCDCKPRGRDEL